MRNVVEVVDLARPLHKHAIERLMVQAHGDEEQQQSAVAEQIRFGSDNAQEYLVYITEQRRLIPREHHLIRMEHRLGIEVSKEVPAQDGGEADHSARRHDETGQYEHEVNLPHPFATSIRRDQHIETLFIFV